MAEQVKDRTKLQTKDLIVAGAFAALYVVVLFGGATVCGFIPILYIGVPLILAVILGPIYMMYATKVPKRGAILILAVLVGLVTGMGGTWQATVWSLIIGVIAELIVASGKYQSKAKYFLSYIVFALTNMGPFWLLFFAKQSFLESSLLYYGQEYVNTLDALTPDWIILVFLAFALVGGVIGGLFGQKLLDKHFRKAGIA